MSSAQDGDLDTAPGLLTMGGDAAWDALGSR